ncbi:hypothetical protein [Nocardia sp. NPDC052566]|uniref:hypothetical protein n=1 Tax=Nocardia sp. NPDC052566 TaxID=3364330 RepID=UPI0037C54AB2
MFAKSSAFEHPRAPDVFYRSFLAYFMPWMPTFHTSRFCPIPHAIVIAPGAISLSATTAAATPAAAAATAPVVATAPVIATRAPTAEIDQGGMSHSPLPPISLRFAQPPRLPHRAHGLPQEQTPTGNTEQHRVRRPIRNKTHRNQPAADNDDREPGDKVPPHTPE